MSKSCVFSPTLYTKNYVFVYWSVMRESTKTWQFSQISKKKIKKKIAHQLSENN